MKRVLALTGLLIPLCGQGGALTQVADAGRDRAGEDWGEDAWSNETWGGDVWGELESGPLLHGFYEAALGGRLQNDPALSDDATLAEVRARLEWAGDLGSGRYSLKGDLYADRVESGLHGDLREAVYRFTPLENVDVQLGQQVLTWGTGDMLFLNDLFPKDWKSFFAGRDETYLKAPATSLKASYFADTYSLDLVWVPQFEPDRYIDGERFSYFSPLTGVQQAAPGAKINADTPDQGEWAARLSGLIGSTEWALYGYRGYWKQPNGLDSAGKPAFPRLEVFGASLRGTLAGGIANTELAWYEGHDHRGDDPRTPNDQLRLLLGYDHELVPNLTGAAQYYVEWLQDYDALEGSQPALYRPDEWRHVLTVRLTWRLRQDNLTLSWFNYWSPSDKDYYLRPQLSYRLDDHWTLSGGANLFGGEQRHTFFSQFADASNLWLRIRYGF